jgi:leucyl aminopeptidase
VRESATGLVDAGETGRARVPVVTLRPGGPAAPRSSSLAVVVLSSKEPSGTPDAAGGSTAGTTAAAAGMSDGASPGAAEVSASAGRVSPVAGPACAELGVDLDTLLTAHTFAGDPGSVLLVPLARAEDPTRLLLLGAGKGAAADWRVAGAALARRAGSGDTVALVADPSAEALAALTEGVALASYRQPRGAEVVPPDLAAPEAGTAGPAEDTDAEPAGPGLGLDEVVVWTSRTLAATELAEATEAVRRAGVIASAVLIARDLINLPSLVKSPEWLANRAMAIARAAGLEASRRDVHELADGGFGGLVAVGGGSPRPPYLVELRYEGPPSGDGAALGHRVLVGKGITFDSGGLSLKPAGSMASMKTDMAGAAAVLATMAALPELGAPGRVTGLLCIAENMIGASAMRPGDVITVHGGQTVEVLNTDAEGRLVLADGLAYAAGSLGADVLVDLATLTGAISVALGRRTAGLFASDDVLAGALAAAADTAGERVWRLPLVEDYRPALESPVADLANIGRALDTGGGSITAALFLREFTCGLPWAHLDIAGTARADGDDGEITRGGTGWGVRTLLRWLTAPAAG